MSNKIFEMLNLFYANKHLYEKIKKRVDKQNNKWYNNNRKRGKQNDKLIDFIYRNERT